MIIRDAAAQGRAGDETAKYPQKAIRFVVGFSPGGSLDTLARMIGQQLTVAWGQPVVIDNRSGAGGTIANGTVAKSAPDGYTVGFVSSSFAMHPSLYRNLPYDPTKDFVPLTVAALAPKILVVHPSLAVSSVKDLIALAKAKPGQLNYASAGIGSSVHLSAELFKTLAGVDLVHVPYKGATGLTDLIAGVVQLSFAGVTQSLPHIRSGRLRGLAVTGAKRSTEVPELPTVAESGLPNYEVTDWYGVLAPAGTPASLARKLSSAIIDVLRIKEVRDRVTAQGLEPLAAPPQELADYIKRDIPKWAAVVKSAGLKPE